MGPLMVCMAFPESFVYQQNVLTRQAGRGVGAARRCGWFVEEAGTLIGLSCLARMDGHDLKAIAYTHTQK